MKYRRVAALALLALSAPACATTQVAGAGPAGPAVEQATLTFGRQSYQIDACTSGDLLQFLGVDLADQKAGAIARLVMDPIDGPRLKVVVRGAEEGSVVLARDQCSLLDADVRPTNWVVNTVRAVSGYVNAECRTPSGQAVSLHARFTHCH
jgi:hypothetical protein